MAVHGIHGRVALLEMTAELKLPLSRPQLGNARIQRMKIIWLHGPKITELISDSAILDI